MSLWNFLGGFAIFNAVCDLFSSKPRQTYVPTRQSFTDFRDDFTSDYHDDVFADKDCRHDLDALRDRVDNLELRLAETNPLSVQYDEIQERIDELQDRIDYLDEIEDIKEELEDLRDELDDLELDRDDW